MSNNNIEFIELLSARFCHDLAGPISAVNNGVEFLQEDSPEMRERASQLIAESAHQAVAKLQFYRQAYGSILEIGEANLGDLRNLINNFLSAGKIELKWSDENINTQTWLLSHRLGKILLNLVIVSQSILIYGGVIEIKLRKIPNGKVLCMNLEGKNPKMDAELEAILMDDVEHCPKMTPRNVQIYLTTRLLKHINATLEIKKSDQHVELVITSVDH
jgi:histidine phosphotransferase ChpT